MVVLAANSDAYGVVLDMLDSGVEVAAIADLRPDADTIGPSGKSCRRWGCRSTVVTRFMRRCPKAGRMVCAVPWWPR